MKTLFKLAWRNIWRNKARTFITAFVVLLIVLLAVVMSSQQYGMYDNMINNIIENTGHVQIHNTNYWESKTINNTFSYNKKLEDVLNKTKHVSFFTPRLESFALASSGEQTKGVAVIGINPEKEDVLSKLKRKIIHYKLTDDVFVKLEKDSISEESREELKVLNGMNFTSFERIEANVKWLKIEDEEKEKILNLLKEYCPFPGEYINENDQGVIIGGKMADNLNLKVGDTLVLIGQGYHGASAAGLFHIKGLIKLPSPELEKGVVFMPLKICPELYSADKLLTSMLIKLDKNRGVDAVVSDLNNHLPQEYHAMSWDKMQPEMMQMIESDKAGGVFMKGIFYMIIGFIIFGTIMMMMAERRREIGITIAIGMKKMKMAAIIFIETLLIGVLGVMIGVGISYPVIYFLNKNPIPLQGEMAEMMEDFGFEPVIFFSKNIDIFYTPALIILIILLGVYIFPLITIIKLNNPLVEESWKKFKLLGNPFQKI